MRKTIIIGALLTCAVGCVDTTLPDLSQQLGQGITDGPYCSPELITELPPETLKVTLIDVGQGDAVWIQTPWYSDEALESLNILVDAGPASSSDIVIDYLTQNGLGLGRPIHAVIVTHAHEDHYGGVESLVSTFDVLNYADPGYSAGSDGFIAARSAAASEVFSHGGQASYPAIPGIASALYQSVNLFGDSVDATLVWSAESPPSGREFSTEGSDVNNTSVVLSLAFAGTRMLLMGDAEQEVEQALIDAAANGAVVLRSNILKVGHHGSNDASSEAFLSAVFPTIGDQNWAVISSGRKSFSGTTLPAIQTLERLKTRVPAYHLLSTENRDEQKSSGEAAGDDHIIIAISSDGNVKVCYAP